MKKSIKVLMFMAGVFMAAGVHSFVNASGGKVQEGNPVFGEDGEVVGVVDPNVDCEKFQSLQSGKQVYFCDTDGD